MFFRKNITFERLLCLVEYHPDTGIFVHRERTGHDLWNKNHAGKQADYLCNRGYRNLSLDGVIYRAHRMAWLYMTGEHPDVTIDHIDLDKGNNKWENLRSASFSQNNWNVTKRSNNTSGNKGVYWQDRAQKWMASIACHGKQYYLGLYENFEDAHAVRVQAALELHGEFARTDDLDIAAIVKRIRTKANRYNRPKQVNNTSGAKGVSWDQKAEKWLAQIAYRGDHKYLGYFDTVESAYAAYKRAFHEIHGDDATLAELDLSKVDRTKVRTKGTRQNPVKSSKNTSGYKGVTFDKARNKWAARLVFRGKIRLAARFDSLEEAHAAYCKASDDIFSNISAK